MAMEKLIKTQYVSFDVFDTLIRRSVARPSDLFRLMEQYVDRAWPDAPKGFAERRMRAERACVERKGAPVTLDEIYAAPDGIFGVWAAQLKELELRLELDGCRPIQETAALLRRYMEQGKRILLISDMYLSSEIIGHMLAKCGIDGYEKLYVSCEIGARKADGSLYRYVLKERGIQPGQLLHIGDNRRGDMVIPAALGIRIHPVRNNEKECCRVPKNLPTEAALSYRTLTACIDNCSSDMSEYERQGARIFGPLLLSFTQWLAQRLRHDGITDVYFMARDGYTMKKAFDILEPSGFQTCYLYCSRRSYVVPMLWKHSAMKDIMAAYNWKEKSWMTLRWFLLKVGLDPKEYAYRAAEAGLEMGRVYTNGTFYKDPVVLAFYETVREEVIGNSRREYEALLAYIRSCDMRGRIAVVDIGYHGTMQQALIELIREAGMDVQIKGYYVGICPTAPLVREGVIDAEGYLYTVGRDEDLFYKYLEFVGIFETLFLGPHGTVKCFSMENGNGRPVLEDYEYDNAEGRLIDEKQIIREYQSGALKLIGYINKVFCQAIPSLDSKTAIYDLMRVGLYPTLGEAQMWGDFRFFNNGILYLGRPRKRTFYLLHPGQFKKDFMALGWRIGFLKRLCVLPLPYNGFLRFIMSIYHRDENR